MRRTTMVLLGYAACNIWGVSICLAPGAASQPVEQTRLIDQIEQLTSTILKDPLDSTASAKLIELRHRQQQQRHEALDGLIQGLQGYLDGKRAGVTRGLEKALPCPYVVDLANAILISDVLNLTIEEHPK